MPPLRNRYEDLVRFADHYLKHFAAQCGRRIEGFSDGALACIRAHPWPGNLRELRNAIERAAILTGETKVDRKDLPTELNPSEATAGTDGTLTAAGAMISLEKLEEIHIRRVLQQTKSLAEAAEVLGIDQATLYRKRKKIGLE
jgi:NtrC-family two-component system response regulator AlgB